MYKRQPTINHNLALYKAKYGDDIPPQYHPLIRSREACLKSSALAASLARKYNSRLHILHLSTADELTLLDSGNRLEKKITGAACVCLLYTSTTDSRQIIRGDIFIALKGENFDGNRYAAARCV